MDLKNRKGTQGPCGGLCLLNTSVVVRGGAETMFKIPCYSLTFVLLLLGALFLWWWLFLEVFLFWIITKLGWRSEDVCTTDGNN